MSKKLKDTKAGRFLAEKIPDAIHIIGDFLPESGTLGIIKNLIDLDENTTPEEKAEIHARVKELYELEVADRDSARKREIEVSKTKKFDLMFNLTGLTGLGAFLFIIYAIVYLDIPENNKEVWIHLIGISEGIVLSIFGYFFGSAVKNDK